MGLVAPLRIFPDQGLNLYLLPWQEDFFFFFLPLSHQENPIVLCLFIFFRHFLQTYVILISGFIILLPCKSRPLLI